MLQVSIIIPCYNHGQYIDDALRSVENIDDKSIYEVIIVNDGSTDSYTNEHLSSLSKQGYNVIFQENKGLSAARNTGITNAKGCFILPLDSDNKIKPEYLYRGIDIMNRDASISMVYGNALLFGEETGIRKPGNFNLQHLLLYNFIDACAIFRRSMWETIGGYDTKMRTGFEDWEFWINAASKGYKFHYVDEVLFDYRVLHDSMAHKLNAEKTKGNKIIEHLLDKHREFYGADYIDTDITNKFRTHPIGFMMKMILKTYFPKKFNDLVERGKLRKYI
jgi:glycosyltransferase involved in cell wall biosynthesis